MANENPFEDAVSFYETNYRLAFSYLPSAARVVLPPNSTGTCRFCRKGEPEVSFKKVAHGLPEALGNKFIVTKYECDECNEKFGNGIEDHFGRWSAPERALYQIRGKNGVPTIKKADGQGWRIALEKGGFNIGYYEDDPVVQLDEAANTLRIEVPRPTHVPINVFKTFVKMAVTLLPEVEVGHFKWTIDWLREARPSAPFSTDIARLYRTFVPGPRPFEGIAVMLFLRKPQVTDVPYCTLIVAYGNECQQAFVPCPDQDKIINGIPLTLHLLPTPYHGRTRSFGSPRTSICDLSGTAAVKEEIAKFSFHAEKAP